MTKHRISDDDAAALLQGRAPAARPELAALAESIGDLRAAAFETAPRPSAALVARLEANSATRPDTSDVPAAALHKGRARQMVSWFAGLGVLAKILLASSVATAAVVGTGAAGVLPGGAQDAFDTVVSTVVPGEVDDEPTSTPTEDPTADPAVEPVVYPELSAHPENFGAMVSELAKELGEDGNGYEFGQSISEAAQNKGETDGTDDSTEAPGQSGSHTEGTVGGKPEGTPGGGNKDK